jgi:hypothetical protein
MLQKFRVRDYHRDQKVSLEVSKRVPSVTDAS